MDDPEIWSAIHRMANVLERLKMDRAAGMGVVTNGLQQTHDSKINDLEKWLNNTKNADHKVAMTKMLATIKAAMGPLLESEKVLEEKQQDFDTKCADIQIEISKFNTECKSYAKIHKEDIPPEWFPDTMKPSAWKFIRK